ncbi:putative quinol monooxygenase [Nitratireductor sp. XY-223]|uniref:putative quinol monooxygenase n=1 Tax=Nitratireductor sp. XY-223 TaxID=2561926 RepID=UPI00145A54D8|nr:putative quinol monooxygenase [Nitratireductor sp. XY-223]
MLIVTVEVVFAEDIIEGAREAFRIMDEETAKEPGCLKYVSSVDVNDPKIVRIYEMWNSMESLKPHFETPQMADFQRALSQFPTASMEAKVYEIGSELPFPNQAPSDNRQQIHGK